MVNSAAETATIIANNIECTPLQANSNLVKRWRKLEVVPLLGPVPNCMITTYAFFCPYVTDPEGQAHHSTVAFSLWPRKSIIRVRYSNFVEEKAAH
jgi:hypothetical protein